MMTDLPNMGNTDNSNKFNLKKTIAIYLNKWFWFVLSFAICLSIAYVNLRYTTPNYLAYAKIMIMDDKDASGASSAFNDLPLFSENAGAMVEDEIQVMTSRAILKNIVEELKLNIQYFSNGRIYDSEIYKKSPIAINFIASDSIINETNFSFQVKIVSSKNFEYKINDDDNPKTIAFGEKIPTFFGGMIITPTVADLEGSIGKDMNVYISPVSYIIESLKNNIYIYQEGKTSSKILNITLQDPIASKAKDIINILINEYKNAAKELKNSNSRNTASFINERVELIASDLVNVDDSIVRFKTGNKLTDVTSEAGQFLSASSLNEQQLDQSKMQLRQLNYMDSSLGDDNSFMPIPSNLGLGDPAISSLSSRYNELISNRERLLKSAGEKNSVVLELDQTLRGLKANLTSSIQNSKKTLGIQINSLENQSSRISSKIYSVPAQESRLRSIERKQGIKESLYLYLLQKREEAAISLTAKSANVKIIDDAYSTGAPVSPNKNTTYIAALFLSFLIPFIIIYVADLLDTKIHNKEDLENEIKNISVLGEIPNIKEGFNKEGILLVKTHDRSILSESFRIIRTNFDFVRRGRNVEQYDNVVFVTSTVNGEGKSFFSLNMALTMANTAKRVLIIGADIRNPQLHNVIKNNTKTTISDIGLTDFLSDKSLLAGDVINSYTINDINIDMMHSGKIPPNPAELLMNNRIKEVFDYASEQYDLVVVDTAPAMLVTDTLLISQYAGHTIYLTRAGYTDKQVLNFAKELHAKNKLNGMMLVVNDVNQANFGYGARYGYYGAPKKNRFFSKKA